MSEPITGELRDAMERYCNFKDENRVQLSEREFENHCDAIDAIHANLERENESLRRELDRVTGENEGDDWVKLMDARDMGVSAVLKEPEGFGLVALPKDADGEPIHIGDVMEWVRYKDDDPTIVRTVSGIGIGVFFAWSDEQGRYAQYEAHAYRHHHADSWERIVKDAHDAGAHGKVFDLSEAVARCKALAGDVE